MKDWQESMVVQEPVQAAIWHCLNHYAYDDAVFLAERLYAEVGSDDALFLLATCYYRSGQPINAYWLLQAKGYRTPQCKFLFARCCLDLEKLSEGETCLAGNVFNKSRSSDDIVTEFSDAAGFVFSMLGDIFRHTDRFGKGTEYYKRSLKCNPFLWSCYQSLCDLGEKPDPTKIFQMSSLPNFTTCQSFCYPSMQPNENVPMTTDTNQDLTTAGIMRESNITSPDAVILTTPDIMVLSPNSPAFGRNRSRGGRNLLGTLPTMQFSPSFGVLPLDTPSPGDGGPSSYVTPPMAGIMDSFLTTAPKKNLSKRNPSVSSTTKPVFTQSGNSSNRDLPMNVAQTPSPQIGPPQQVLFQQSQGVRRSSRLFSSSNSVKENAAKKIPMKNKFQSPKAPTRKTKKKKVPTATLR